MTNAMIIFNASCELMEKGIIGTTGRTLSVELPDGTKQEMLEPEPIHTFQKWKDLGYCVDRGQKSIATLMIWKAGKENIKNESDQDEETIKMFMKKAFFFSQSQVKPITNPT